MILFLQPYGLLKLQRFPHSDVIILVIIVLKSLLCLKEQRKICLGKA